jgi:UDP-3-O-[3-hydroxymyristoyl] N-acetylglucosamine deacetylase
MLGPSAGDFQPFLTSANGSTSLTSTSRSQRTISRPIAIEGFGYWSGEDVRIQFRPAAPDTGVVFVRTDLNPHVRIPAELSQRIDVPRRTVLSSQGASVEMVEHILAACAGLGLDNCEIWTDRAEMPGCDGSASPFVEALLRAGLIDQDALRPQFVVNHVVRVGDDGAWIEARPPDHLGLSLLYGLDYGDDNAIGCQNIELAVTAESFRCRLAPARTFLLLEEADWLRSRGLGGRVSYSDVLVFDRQGPIRNTLRFPDECVRHKALDFIGDLALAGRDFIGRFVAYRSGHRLNAELVRVLLSEEHGARLRRKSA